MHNLHTCLLLCLATLFCRHIRNYVWLRYIRFRTPLQRGTLKYTRHFEAPVRTLAVKSDFFLFSFPSLFSLLRVTCAHSRRTTGHSKATFIYNPPPPLNLSHSPLLSSSNSSLEGSRERRHLLSLGGQRAGSRPAVKSPQFPQTARRRRRRQHNKATLLRLRLRTLPCLHREERELAS